MNTKLLRCVAATAMTAASVVATPAIAFRGGGGFGGGHMMGGMGGHPMMSMGGSMPGGRMFTGRSVFVPGGNRFVGTPFAGQHAFVNRRFDEGRRGRIEDRMERRRDRIEDRREGRRDRIEDRFEDRFRHRRFFVNRFDNFAFLGVPFAYDYAAYGNGCWRWDGWQWINICSQYGGYNYGY
jgi:hypothetical protein